MADSEASSNHCTSKRQRQQLLTELQKLYAGKGQRRDVFGRRVALPSEVAAWVADARRREAGQA